MRSSASYDESRTYDSRGLNLPFRFALPLIGTPHPFYAGVISIWCYLDVQVLSTSRGLSRLFLNTIRGDTNSSLL